MPNVLIISATDLRGDLGRTVLWQSRVHHSFATDSRSGLERAGTLEPSLIVVDAALPDSVRTVRELRDRTPSRRAAIAVMSRDPFLEDAPLFRAAGANVVLPTAPNPAVWDVRLDELLNVPQRREAHIPVQVSAWSRAAEGGDPVEGRALNISVKGLLLEAARPLEVGRKLDVRFVLPGSDERFHVLGEVVRQGDNARIGIRFLVLRGEARQAIESFVEAGSAAAMLSTTTRALLPAETDEWEAALRATETLKSAFLEISLDSIIVMTHEGRVVDVNRAAERTLGYTRDELVGKTIGETIAGPSARDPHRQRLAHILATGSVSSLEQRLEMTVHHRDGSEIPVELTLSATSAQGRPLYAASVRDLRAARRAEALQRAVQLVNEATSAVGDYNGLCVNLHGVVAEVLSPAHFFVALRDDTSPRLAFSYFVDPVDASPPAAEAMETLAAYVLRTGEPLLASPSVVSELVSNGQVEPVASRSRDPDSASMPGASWFGVPLHRQGQAFGVVAVQAAAPEIGLTDDDRRSLTVLAPAIGVALERKQAEARIHYLAYHDALTGLPNRNLLLDRLQLALSQAARDKNHLAVLFLDLDRFKGINDLLGHRAGDEVLKEAANRLNLYVRKGDTLARIDSDTFTILVRGLKAAADAGRVAESLHAALGEPLVVGERELFVTTCIGISVFPEDGADVETLLRNADTALYRAKEQGRDSFRLYDPSMNAEALQRLRLEHSLRRALSRDELRTYYQPVMDLATGEIHGVEALLRWQHPERGLVFPVDFIELAENTGLIRSIGTWGLKAACAQARQWQVAGHPRLRVAVNLSARQLHHMRLVSEVTSALQEASLEPTSLELEITETSAMQNAAAAIQALGELKALGVRISIDDFGMGYSSLSQLQRLPIDTLKIDQSFVRDITTDPGDAAIATAIINLGHTLGLEVMAEGVETAEQLAFLQAQRCDRVQGFLLSKALPAEECAALLKSHRPQQWRRANEKKETKQT
jgi:diguanylate cyclase (GGDEF)-like protein/PAS domain S-box-containing protein